MKALGSLWMRAFIKPLLHHFFYRLQKKSPIIGLIDAAERPMEVGDGT
jgi:hypothetical protein